MSKVVIPGIGKACEKVEKSLINVLTKPKSRSEGLFI